MRNSLRPFCMALFFALPPLLQAQPRLMADAEMDRVCAKGTAGFIVDPVALNQMFFGISRQTSLGQVSGSGVISVEAIPNSSGTSQILVSPQIAVPGRLQTTLQVQNGTVRVRGDVNINMQTIPSVVRALQQNGVVLPPGINPLASALSGMGGMR